MKYYLKSHLWTMALKELKDELKMLFYFEKIRKIVIIIIWNRN